MELARAQGEMHHALKLVVQQRVNEGDSPREVMEDVLRSGVLANMRPLVSDSSRTAPRTHLEILWLWRCILSYAPEEEVVSMPLTLRLLGEHPVTAFMLDGERRHGADLAGLNETIRGLNRDAPLKATSGSACNVDIITAAYRLLEQTCRCCDSQRALDVRSACVSAPSDEAKEVTCPHTPRPPRSPLMPRIPSSRLSEHSMSQPSYS